MFDTTIEFEITRELPHGVPTRFLDENDGELLFVAYGCALMERDTGKSLIYKAVNLRNGKSEVLGRRKTPLIEVDFPKAAKQMRSLSVADEGYFSVDRRQGQSLGIDKLEEVLLHIFRTLLPGHGYSLRQEQLALAEHLLEVIRRRGVSLSEAGVGIGKTHAYLIVAALAKRGRLNDFWTRNVYPELSYSDSARMPIVITTSSIALQKAIVRDYLPEISRILMEHRIITTPLTAVLRKGKEHYLCEMNLRQVLRFEQNPEVKKLLLPLLNADAPIDLADTTGLTPFIRQKICVPEYCDINCSYRDRCRYLRFLENAKSPDVDFQVCNHQIFLVDVLRRNNSRRTLLPPYQMVVIDEAHKFLAAARSIYGVKLSNLDIPQIAREITDFATGRDEACLLAREYAKKLCGQNKRLFRMLNEAVPQDGGDDDTERFSAAMDKQAARHLKNIRGIIDDLGKLWNEKPGAKHRDRREKIWQRILRQLSDIQARAITLAKYDQLICWLEKPDIYTTPGIAQEILLCGLPKSLGEMLYEQIWQKNIPFILTSGTLSADGNFSYIKRILGLNAVRSDRLMETSKPSPFDYQNNALLYISENIPFPNSQDKEYIAAITAEIERLIRAAHGHAVVLFTSYKAMDMVWELLEGANLPFPMLRMDRGGVSAIERFKHSGKAVLFSSGALWEGIDIPGDALSMLIIVKLPFSVPDPISEYEQTLYSCEDEYKARVIVPEMLIKLKQGFGRLLRLVSDTGVVAILDSRVAHRGPYRAAVLKALPSCRVTDEMRVVQRFYKEKKPAAYFM